MKRAVFFDRDGVINPVVMRGDVVASPRTFDEFTLYDDVAEEMARLKAAGFRIIVVTNQPDIARGKMTVAELERMHALLRAQLPVDDIIVCPHDDSDRCQCRKPLAGMLLAAAEHDGLDVSCSYLIGDSWKDMGAAQRAGCCGILLAKEYNGHVAGDITVAGLHQAIDFILSGGRNT